MSVPTLLAPSGDGLGTGWLFLALAGVFLLFSLWRRLRIGPVRRRSGPGGRPAGTRAGRPQVGEIWWAEVPFEDGTGSKDRPCLVVDSHGLRRQVLTITSSDKTGRPGYVEVDRRGWGHEDGTSWLRLDRRVALEPGAFRRLAGPCPPRTWAQVGKG
ncbi:type II toxin-antitoxin system PemK/MazF family toxin [Aquipuribacter sp. MA13-6]|uniref:type II toxin-antitoxin system PemK/MazF family toxin n=1 Tax=unclassified Aquipuribacter TaxID=2635084 RepID=UPI003EE94DBD